MPFMKLHVRMQTCRSAWTCAQTVNWSPTASLFQGGKSINNKHMNKKHCNEYSLHYITWHKFLRSDRGGVGRQVDHSSWYSSLSLLLPSGHSHLSQPWVSWCSRRISSVPMWPCQESPSGVKHLREILVQMLPVEEKKRKVFSNSESSSTTLMLAVHQEEEIS